MALCGLDDLQRSLSLIRAQIEASDRNVSILTQFILPPEYDNLSDSDRNVSLLLENEARNIYES